MSIITSVAATQTLTLTGQPLNTEAVVVGDKTYAFQTTLTDVDGYVLIGADAEESIENLVAAINLATGAGSLYAASMTKNQQVKAVKGSATTLVVTALVAGTVGNLIPSTESLTNGSWGAGTLASGTGPSDYAEISAYAQSIRDSSPHGVNAGVRSQLVTLETELDAFG